MLNYFNELRERIINKQKWEKDRFHVFDYEAGTGKSRNTFRFVGEMTKESPYRVLYVQRFIRDDELNNSVALINKHSGRKVAVGFTGEDSKKAERRILAKEAQVLIISHRMYNQICRGNHKELIEGRDILIIDEYPDLLEKVTLSENDIGYLWMMNYKYQNDLLENLAFSLREKLAYCSVQQEIDKKNEMLFIDFRECGLEKLKIDMPEILKTVSDGRDGTLLLKVLQILTNGCFFYERSFHTFNSQVQFKLLKSNIILDANGFDYRYTLSKKFQVEKQPKFFEYSHSIFHHYEVNTSKKGLSKQINLPEKALDIIHPEKNGKTLFITDQDNQLNLEGKIINYLILNGVEENEAKVMLKDLIRIDYFGNIIGVNTYRDFDNVVVLKTPNFDYLSYALSYFYNSKNDGGHVGDVDIFKHDIVENIRKSVIAGEIYQAIKRVNRDNTRISNMYVFTTNQDAVDMVLTQLPGIQYKKNKLSVNKKKQNSSKRVTVLEHQIEDAKKIILDAKSNGVSFLRKKEIRDLIGVTDKSNFSRILDAIQTFLDTHECKNSGQKIILTGS